MIKVGDKVITHSGKIYGRVAEIWYGVLDECMKIQFVAKDGIEYIFCEDELEKIIEEDKQMAKLTGYKMVAAITGKLYLLLCDLR